VEFKTKIVPRYAETDKMGIIHHSVYPIWYEVGRTELCDKINMPYHIIEELGVYLAVININVDYKSPALYGDELTLITRIKTCGKVKVEFEYNLYNQENKLINQGTSTHAWLNKNLKPINIAKTNEEVYELLLKNMK